MSMTPSLRKLALTVHITSSVGWLGAVVAYLTIIIAALTNHYPLIDENVWFILELIGWYVIVPMAITTLITGLAMSLGTQWGLFRHYWIVFKLILTSLATMILLLNMPTVSFFAGNVAATNSASLAGFQGQLLHAGGGLGVLIVTTILSVYKPRGITRYGLGKQHEKN